MENLKKKTFYTIFTIISLFLVITVIFFNTQNYQKEYKAIKSNFKRMNLLISGSKYYGPNNKDMLINDLNNKIIMDYKIYTFILDRNNNVINKISHNDGYFNNEIREKVNKILYRNSDNAVKINSLYFNNISYSLKYGDYLVVIDTLDIQHRLLSMLVISIILLLICEIVVFYISKRITEWITIPVEDTFKKQKDFIADASHELKTPLAVIMASASCIDENEKNEKWINNIKSESDRMSNLITKLLELSKSENKDNKKIYSLNNISKIVEKRALVLESLAFDNNVKIKAEIEKDIMFKCNGVDIDEVVNILIDNAIKHSYKSTTIKIKLYKNKNEIILEVINSGKEIPQEECDKIFERFYRSDKSRNRDSNRYGLGLAIAKNIVNNHDGVIKAFSKDDLTTFKVIFKQK